VTAVGKRPEAGHRVEGQTTVSRRSRTVVDPEALERIRASRAAEDAALASLFRQVAVVEAAKRRRARALVALDAEVHKAEDTLADERAALVGVAGLQRAATVLAVTPATLRKMLPHVTDQKSSARFGEEQSR
jgi:predicted NAD-dependent protein-ADP-ribosyltransferase YbiA (DUF1768 family)